MSMIEFITEIPNETETSRKLLNTLISATGGQPNSCVFNSITKRELPEGNREENFTQEFYKTLEYPVFTKTGKLSKKTRKVSEQTEEFKGFINQVKNELYENKPNLVVAVGNESLKALTGLDGILQYRGSVIESKLVPGLKVLPIVNPQWIVSNARWEYYYITLNDLKKAFYESEFFDIRRKQFESIIAPSVDQCISFLRNVARNNQRWSFDIETRYGYVTCLGLCVGTTAICIPIHTTQGCYFNVNEETAVWQELGRVFQNNPNLVGQNLSYDLDYMLSYGIEAQDVLLDTMIGQFILAPEMPKGLDYICSLYTDAIYYKEDSKAWHIGLADETLWKYNCKDTFYTLEASHAIEALLKKNKFWHLWADYGKKLIDVALEIQRRGLLINSKKQETAQRIILKEYNHLRPEVVKATGFNINVNSPKVVQEYLRNNLCLPLKRKRGTGKLTADEDALMGFLTKELPKKYQSKVHPCYREILTLIMKERHLRKAGTYAGIKIKSGGDWDRDTCFSDADNRVRCSVNIPGTKTWRFSMSESPYGTGWNLQTAPKKLRFYDAPEGRIFLQPDQKQAEARVVAWRAQCKKQIDLFNDPSRSIHLEFGKTVFHHDLSKDTPEYTAAKSGVHGGNFRMMAEKLAKTTGIHVAICEKAINGYHSTYPEIRINYHNNLKEEVLSNGYLENPFGLRRYFFHAIGGARIMGKLSDDDWNDICSWIPQSTIPFITNLTYLKVSDILPYVWLHQQGHDAVLISVPKGKEKETSDVWMDVGRISCQIKGRELIIPWEMCMGYSWDYMYETYGDFSYDEWAEKVKKESHSDDLSKLSEEKLIKAIYGVL